MRAVRPLLFALLPLFASCTMLYGPQEAPVSSGTRIQGELSVKDGKLLLRPCQEQRRFVINDSGNTGLLQESAALLDTKDATLFADVSGDLDASKVAGSDGQLNLTRLYRVQREGHGCDDPNFKRQVLRASGHEPGWAVSVNAKGMVLERPGQEPLALPYLEEQLGDGRFNLTSEANGLRLELWVAPQRCVDSASGAVQFLSAELRSNGKVERGCAYFGGSRNQ
jgi:putative lipoprotein